MEILVLPFLALFAWILFSFMFISKKVSEGKPKGTMSRFWLVLLLFSFGCGFLGSLLFDLVLRLGVLPELVENGILVHAGSFCGFLIGAIYVLVNSDATKN